MTTSLTVTPSAGNAGDGILFVVTGPVGAKYPDATTKLVGTSTGQIVVKDANSKVRAASPVFVNENAQLLASEKVDITGTFSGGYITLGATVRQPYDPSDPSTAESYGYDVVLPTTGHIVYDASDDDITAALLAAWDPNWQSYLPGASPIVKVTGGRLGVATVHLDFGNGPFAGRKVTVTVNDHTTGGSASKSEITAGGALASTGVSYLWGPIQLAGASPSGAATYSADVIYVDIAEADSTNHSGDSIIGSPESFTVTA